MHSESAATPLSALENLLCCPQCGSRGLHRDAEAALCRSCGASVAIVAGKYSYVTVEAIPTEDARFQKAAMTNETRTARLFNLGRRLITSDFVPDNRLADELRRLPRGGIAVELGAGNRRLRPDVINVDLFPFPNVDVMMNIERLHFPDDSIDLVILDSVIEHVPRPQRVIEEVHRVLKHGGKVVSIAPWVFPYHGYPKNYYNFSVDGHHELFASFSAMTAQMHHGPTAALTNLVSEYFAIGFSRGNRTAYTLMKAAVLLVISWLKYLDLLWVKSDRSLRIASTICVIAVK
jgi:SAM-dependent methyltransferase